MSLSDFEAEKTLAVALATMNDAWDYGADTLTADMFASDTARDVFNAVRELICSAKRVTPIAVQDLLVKAGRGGSIVPGWLKSPPCMLDEVEALAQRVRELWSRRRIIEVAGQVANSAERIESQKSAAVLSELLSGLEPSGGRARGMPEMIRDYYAETAKMAAGNGKQVQFQTGMKAYDGLYQGIRTEELVIIAARPGQGKSSLVMTWAIHLAQTGVPVGLFWLEDNWRDAVRRFLANRYGLSMADLRADPRQAEKKLAGCISAPNADLGRNIFVDDTHGLTAADMIARMRRMVREHGVRVFFADHVGEVIIERDDRWGDRHDLALGRAAKMYRDACKDLDAVPILCSQLNRAIEKRADRRPVLSDLDGSGKLEAAARTVVFVYHGLDPSGERDGRVFLDIQKASTGPSPQLIECRWNPMRMRLEDRS